MIVKARTTEQWHKEVKTLRGAAEFGNDSACHYKQPLPHYTKQSRPLHIKIIACCSFNVKCKCKCIASKLYMLQKPKSEKWQQQMLGVKQLRQHPVSCQHGLSGHVMTENKWGEVFTVNSNYFWSLKLEMTCMTVWAFAGEQGSRFLHVHKINVFPQNTDFMYLNHTIDYLTLI